MTDYQSENLILHFVTEDDLAEAARTWPADHHPLSDAEAQEAVAYMRENYGRNTKDCVSHLCLAVCGKDQPGTIMGWCGLDGTRNHSEPELFILLDEEYRNQGYGTKCVKELLRIAAEDYMTAMERSPVKDTEIKILLQAALTDETESRSVFMHSIDASYRYEGYARYKTEDV